MVEQQRAWASIGRAQLCIAESKAEEGDEKLRKEALAAAKNAFMKSLDISNKYRNFFSCIFLRSKRQTLQFWKLFNACSMYYTSNS